MNVNNLPLTGQVVINGEPVNAGTIQRINACLNVCTGISTEVLELNATAGGVATLERQRNAMLAALKKYQSFFDQMFAQCCSNPVFDSWGKQVNLTDLNEAHSLGALALASMKKATDELPALTATGSAGEGAANHTAAITKLLAPAFQPTARYTSVSKGGSYERLGAIRGAGSLKGLSGIAYRDEKGSLFIREPECFAKRMVLIKADGGAQ